MRLIDADRLKEVFRRNTGHDYSEFIDIQPTVCDIEQLSATRYNNGFYDGAKGMTEKWNGRIEQIRAEIEDLDRYYDNDYFSTNNCPMYKCNEVLLIIDKYRESEE